MGMNVFDFLRFVLFAVRIYDGKNFDLRFFVRSSGSPCVPREPREGGVCW